MHEMSLAESVVDLVEYRARNNGWQHIKGVRLEIGKLSGVEPDAIRFCFDAVAGGTLAEGAALDIVEQDGIAWCFDCARTIALAVRGDPCPECGGFRLRVDQGLAMRIMELEIE
ncbi:MAG TPA: hydrogenase maturation nickel metallochaperone HypA [Sideroxyarcus sp.]|nr:hydrogenase maturation nickel metallochaperone HypA [Sideroxyarcus sp.]